MPNAAIMDQYNSPKIAPLGSYTEATAGFSGMILALADTEYVAIILDHKRGQYFGLNEPAVEVLDALRCEATVSGIAHQISSRTGVSHERAVADVRCLLSRMIALGVLPSDA